MSVFWVSMEGIKFTYLGMYLQNEMFEPPVGRARNRHCNQPIAALVVAGVAMLAVLPVLLGLSLFMLSLLTFTFMTLGIVMVSMMILMTLLTIFLVLFGLGYYFSYLKSNAERQSRRAHLN
ncbi:uncharacterized protein LOC103506001 [Diaphorina citri]|uniref:Uncharacterized protein LOC103506001 n=1 Tax=Diaphorina citri TaxID=121845 RepID=A0A1S3CWR0_DIACI|nr:uncharacterized protein LOC103506001 [Diaphorina citri]